MKAITAQKLRTALRNIEGEANRGLDIIDQAVDDAKDRRDTHAHFAELVDAGHYLAQILNLVEEAKGQYYL